MYGLARVTKNHDRAYSGLTADTSELLVQCVTADEGDRALGLGFAVDTMSEVAAKRGAPAPDGSDTLDFVEDVLEAQLRPYRSDEAPEEIEGNRPIVL